MEKDTLSITYAKNLEKHNFTSTLNLQIDSKVNIKTVLNVSCYMLDTKIETASGKAVVNGKISVKVLYIDTDNITNTLTEIQPFSETILDNSITSDCYIFLANHSCMCQESSSETTLKVECSLSFTPVLYLNLAVPNKIDIDDKTICKNSLLKTNRIEKSINTHFNYTSTLETKNNISKILNSNSVFNLENVTAQDGYMIAEGKLFTCIVYETQENEETKILQLCDTFNVKTDIEIEGLKQENILDLFFNLDNNNDNISTEIEDDNSIITITHQINVAGLILQEVNIECIEDIYSTKNELELSKSSREFVEETKSNCVFENIVGEISLNKDEPIIEEVISNLKPTTEITNTYIKNNTLHFEGIINSTVVYIDESRELKSKVVEIPFVVNTKIEIENLPTNHIELNVVTNKVKSRRGTIIEIEYDLLACVRIYKHSTKELIDNVTLGKNLDFSQYDYQIYIAKPNESNWDLCKRVKCHPDELTKLNKDLPSTFIGGEKVIIKR